MTDRGVEELAKRYAAEWDVPCGDILSLQRERAWWLLFFVRYYRLQLRSEAGECRVVIDALSAQVEFFEFIPTDGKSWMLPLWAAYPVFNSVTIGWRMGSGEDYKIAWHAWWRDQLPTEKDRYRIRFPEPAKGGWKGFYDEIAEVPGDASNMIDLLMGRVPPLRSSNLAER